jgi:hypothetical protein
LSFYPNWVIGLAAFRLTLKNTRCFRQKQETFPAFIISLRIRAGEVHWNSQVPTGIREINGNNLLTDYHSVTDADVENTRAAHVDPRAIQNTKAMYKCVKSRTIV